MLFELQWIFFAAILRVATGGGGNGGKAECRLCIQLLLYIHAVYKLTIVVCTRSSCADC